MPLSVISLGGVGGIRLENRGGIGGFSSILTTVPDSIRTYMVASLATYDAAPNNTWVKITKSEYDNLAANLQSVTKVGASDAQVDTRLSGTGGTAATQYSPASTYNIPSGRYVFGMILESWNQNGSGSVGYATVVTGSIANYNNYFALGGDGNILVGSILPVQRNYFVIKKPTFVTSQTVYPFVTMSVSPNGVNTAAWLWGGSSWTLFPAASNAASKYQLLTTTVKQW
jgi:hypothetical protein